MAFKFSDNETVTNIEDVPNELRVYYGQGTDGSFALKDDMKAAATAWDGMANANAKIRQDNKELQKGKIDLSPLSEFGATPQEIREAFNARISEMSDVIESKKDAVNPDKLRKQMTEAFEEKERLLVGRNEALQGQLYTTLVVNEAHKAISEHKGDAHLLMGFITESVKTVEENGKLVARVFDAEGDVRLGGTGLPMTVSERVAEMKRDPRYSKLFEADAKPGSNPPPNRLPGGMPAQKKDKSSVEKIAAGLEAQQRR